MEGDIHHVQFNNIPLIIFFHLDSLYDGSIVDHDHGVVWNKETYIENH